MLSLRFHFEDALYWRASRPETEVGGASLAARGRGRDVARFAEPCPATSSLAIGAVSDAPYEVVGASFREKPVPYPRDVIA